VSLHKRVTFLASKEEELVPDDWPANGSTKVVIDQLGSWAESTALP
jgi:hypothetical protein